MESKDKLKEIQVDKQKEKDPMEEAFEILDSYYEGCSKPVSFTDSGE